DLDVRDLEAPLVTADGQSAHLEAVGGTGLLVDRLVRRYSRGNKHHLRQAELNVRLLGAHQVTKMWRIERSAQDPDAHGVSRPSGSLTDLAVALDQVLDRAQLPQPDRAARMELLGRVPDLGAHPKFCTVGEAR